MTEPSTGVDITVRYFAAASAASGRDSEALRVAEGSTVADLVGALGRRYDGLGPVLARCSYLRDGMAVRDPATVLESGQTIDVLPPFAGG